MGRVIAIAFWVLVIWLIRRDTRKRDGISLALWIPTAWAFIALSRPLSMWLNFGGGTDTLEGSPLDRIFYFGVIFLSVGILIKRRLEWTELVKKNWPVFLFYGYLLITVLWADYPVVSFKRWVKDFGNVFVALVILTERNPEQAIRAVFIRCAYILLPLSVIFLRYFPELGRAYSRSGGMQVVGVTTQKNSLGALVLICGLVLLWEWLERTKKSRSRENRAERYLPMILFSIGAYLILQCDSKTSIVCMALGIGVLVSIKLPLLRRRIGALGIYTLLGALAFYAADFFFGIRESVVSGLGRDMTFTGRTEVWREILALKTDPIFGIGFCSIWSNNIYLERLPIFVRGSAHNGYLEMYIDGGLIAVLLVVLMLLTVAWRINSQLTRRGNYALLRFAFLLAALIGDFSESHFGRMSSLWFAFLLIALEMPAKVFRSVTINTDEVLLVAAPRASVMQPI